MPDEQKKIFKFLDHETDKIDTLIEKQQQLIKLLKEKRHAVISHAVTKGLNPNAPMRDSGVGWLGKIPEHWTLREGVLHIISMNKEGKCVAYSNKEGIFHYYADSTKNEPIKKSSVFVKLKK